MTLQESSTNWVNVLMAAATYSSRKNLNSSFTQLRFIQYLNLQLYSKIFIWRKLQFAKMSVLHNIAYASFTVWIISLLKHLFKVGSVAQNYTKD